MSSLNHPRSMLNATTISTRDVDNTHLMLLVGGGDRFGMTRVTRQGPLEARGSEGDSETTTTIIPDSTTIEANAFLNCTELERIATEAGLSIEEWGRSNWRKARALKLRLTMVSCIKRLSLLDYGELDNHLTTIQKPQIVRECVRFVVEVGEPGLMREIVK
jgi:hypothetical protein